MDVKREASGDVSRIQAGKDHPDIVSSASDIFKVEAESLEGVEAPRKVRQLLPNCLFCGLQVHACARVLRLSRVTLSPRRFDF
jgi:hypothetical protein